MSIQFMAIPTLTVSALSALFAVADGAGSQARVPLSRQTATQYSANASVVGVEASGALDATLLTVTQLVRGTVSPLHTGRNAVRKERAIPCAADGTATMTIAGASARKELNGQLDADETYQIAFIDCRGAGGLPVLNGAVTMNVLNTNDGGIAVTFSTTTLKATTPRGTVSFIGNAGVQRTVMNTGKRSRVTTRLTATSLDVATDFNHGAGNFMLSSVDLTRQASYTVGVLQSTSYSGTHALAAASVDYTVAIQPGATFDANGAPIQGSWVITLPNQRFTTSVANGTVMIGIEDEAGSMQRSFSLPLVAFAAAAG